MTIWPVRERPGASNPIKQVITYDSHAPHHASNWGCDFHASLHDRWVAIAHNGVGRVHVLGRWEGLGECGAACEIQWDWRDTVYNVRYCHGHEHYFARWPNVGGIMDVGDELGEVGMTGKTDGPHLHLAATVGAPWGRFLELGNRVRVEELLAEIQTSYGEDDMTDEQRRLMEIGLRAEEHLPNAANVVNGWGARLISPGIKARLGPTGQIQAGRELTDTAGAMRYVLLGVSS